MRELRKLKQEKLLFFDIETARVVKELEPESDLYNSWEYKVNKDGKMEEQEVIDSYRNQSGLYPEFAKVISIVVGKIVKDKIVLVTIDDEDERGLLNRFNKLIERNSQDTLIGFVNIGFDSPFVFKRMLINGISPSSKLDSSGLAPWEVEEVDLSMIWKGTSFNRGSLLNIATAFGLPSPKDDISGADVGNVYWDEGKEGLKRISKYCRKDVITTINIFRKMLLQEPLELKTSEIEVDESKGILEELLNGAAYGAKEKKTLTDVLRQMSDSERQKAFTVLDAVTSKKKGKITKLTKTHVKALRKELEVE